MKMKIHEYLHLSRSFERKYFPFVRTIEDLDMLIVIGLYQERGVLLTMKEILSFGIGSAATLERRLARMKELGIVTQSRSKVDKRNIDLKLSPKVSRNFQRYASVISSSMHHIGGQMAD
jgi:hypothetical protein